MAVDVEIQAAASLTVVGFAVAAYDQEAVQTAVPNLGLKTDLPTAAEGTAGDLGIVGTSAAGNPKLAASILAAVANLKHSVLSHMYSD